MARLLPLPGILLIPIASGGFLLSAPVQIVNWTFAGVVLAYGIAVYILHRRAAAHPGVSRTLFLLGAGLLLTDLFVGMAPFLGLRQAVYVNLFKGIVMSTGLTFGAWGLLGSALTLRVDPGHSLYRTFSFIGATFSLCGMGLTAASEIARLFHFRTGFLSLWPSSLSSVVSLAMRVSLFACCVLALLRTSDVSSFVRRQTIILKLMGGYLLCYAIYLATFSVSVLSGSQAHREDLERYMWLNATTFILFLINPVLLSLAFRKPEAGYKSTATTNPSGGAEA